MPFLEVVLSSYPGTIMAEINVLGIHDWANVYNTARFCTTCIALILTQSKLWFSVVSIIGKRYYVTIMFFDKVG